MTSSCCPLSDPDAFAVTTTRPRPDAVVVRALGEIDLLSAPTWRCALHDAVAADRGTRGRLVVDLSSVTFLGASGLGVLLDVVDLARDAELDLRLVVGTRRVARVLHVMGVDREFVVEATVERAVRSAPVVVPRARRER